MNSILLHGRLARDPIYKTINTPRGERIGSCTLTVATDRKRGEEADFIDCRAYRKDAETISKWLKKGDAIVILGELQHSRGNGWSVLVESWEFGERCNKMKPEQPPDFQQIKEKLPWEE